VLSKRLGMTLISLALSVCLVGGATFALFTARSAAADNTLAAGTVSLGTPSSTVINIARLLPGDSGEATYTVQYTGSLGAWLGVDTVLTGDLTTCHTQPSEDDDEDDDDRGGAHGDSSPSALSVSDPTRDDDDHDDGGDTHSNSLTVTIIDGFGNQYHPNTPNQVIKVGPGTFGPWTTGGGPQFTIRWSLGRNAKNACKRKSALLSLQVHGVQALHNTNVAGNGPNVWY
jgi:predicted ribosomally synthesized peptide with SipW-like signal peptide